MATKQTRRAATKRPVREIDGEVVLDHEGGLRFYHKHLSPKAKAKKKVRRKMRKRSRR
ncbi:MAG: hypothetical protein ACWGQW_15400 [bacterium]